MLYANRANERERLRPKSSTGDGTEPIWEYEVDEATNTKKLVCTARENIYDRVQESLEETKIKNIVRRATYDPSELGTMDWMNRGETLDVTSLPQNMHEFHDFMNTAEKDFKALPREIRELFDNDIQMFVAEFGTPAWEQKINSLNKGAQKEEVKQDEPKQ